MAFRFLYVKVLNNTLYYNNTLNNYVENLTL